MSFIENYQRLVAKGIEDNAFKNEPQGLYAPNNYILDLGGKRLRPVMVLMAADMFKVDLDRAVKPALGVEYFHNFTLMHDDIMDNAPLRRGKTTVHKKYDLNTAILSGDALMVKSYEMFEDLPAETYKEILKLFTKTALQICEGQQYDMEFGERESLTFDDYLEMILLKTGVMVAMSFKIGAMMGNARKGDEENLYEFGKNLGIAFQIKDDYLDVFGKQGVFGKQHAGDIYENKKTVLYFFAKQKADEETLKELDYWYDIKTDNIDKIYAVEKIYRKLKVGIDASEMIKEYSQKAKDFLQEVRVEESRKDPIYELCNLLIDREN